MRLQIGLDKYSRYFELLYGQSTSFEFIIIQVSPDITRWSGSTELMRVIGEARPIFSGPTNFYVYGSIRYCLHYVTVLLIFDPIKCVKYLEAIN